LVHRILIFVKGHDIWYICNSHVTPIVIGSFELYDDTLDG